MKKEYRKPYLMVESFQLDAAIATTCTQDGKEPIGWSLDTCNLDAEKGVDFGYFGNACRHDVRVEGDNNDLICYHGPIPFESVYLNS